jgi:putative glutamine amidotransferase
LNGLIIGGGADISSELYGGKKLLREEIKRSTRRGLFSILIMLVVSVIILGLRWVFGQRQSVTPDPERDKLEWNLLEQATNKGIPVLGICRGMQLINVFYGGTLHQEVDQFYSETGHPQTAWPYKRITLKPGTKLHDIFKTTRLKVNALHHQAVDKLGRGIRTSAVDSAGVIQAIEHPDAEFILGVQWHPEFLPQIPIQKQIFYALINAAGRLMQ